MGVKFQSRIIEKTSTEIATTIVWIGTREEMLQLQRDTPINGLTDDGMVKSVRVNQVSPLIWQCEQRFTLAADGELTEKPDNSYGKKSAQLHGSMLSMPLETRQNYSRLLEQLSRGGSRSEFRSGLVGERARHRAVAQRLAILRLDQDAGRTPERPEGEMAHSARSGQAGI